MCVSKSTECIRCSYVYSKSQHRVLVSVPAAYREIFLCTELVIIKKSQSVCFKCNNIMLQELLKTDTLSIQNIDGKFIEEYCEKKHSVTKTLLNRLVKRYCGIKIKYANFERNFNKKIDELQKENAQLKEQLQSRKWRRIKASDPNYDYQQEIECIPQGKNKWRNRIHYQLIGESECILFTGHPRSIIIQQAEICQWNPELVFHARHFIYCYHSRRLQAQYFGWSHTNLGEWVAVTINRLNDKYALPRLINGKAFDEQSWNWDEIHKLTPEWVYLLRQLNKDDPNCPNIITADSTYQYCKSPETDQDSRKKLISLHKQKQTLIKVHIWSIPNGQPVAVHCHFADWSHA